MQQDQGKRPGPKQPPPQDPTQLPHFEQPREETEEEESGQRREDDEEATTPMYHKDRYR